MGRTIFHGDSRGDGLVQGLERGDRTPHRGVRGDGGEGQERQRRGAGASAAPGDGDGTKAFPRRRGERDEEEGGREGVPPPSASETGRDRDHTLLLHGTEQGRGSRRKD